MFSEQICLKSLDGKPYKPFVFVFSQTFSCFYMDCLDNADRSSQLKQRSVSQSELLSRRLAGLSDGDEKGSSKSLRPRRKPTRIIRSGSSLSQHSASSFLDDSPIPKQHLNVG